METVPSTSACKEYEGAIPNKALYDGFGVLYSIGFRVSDLISLSMLFAMAL